MSTLKLTDAVLFDRSLPFDARAVLALTLGHQGKNPSVDYTAAAIGLQPRTVLTAQRVLEYGTRVWTMDDAGAIALVADCPATATFDRPSEWYERHPNSPQFHRSTKLDVLAPWAKPADHAHAELPADIAARLPKREHHNSFIRLVALAYAREQLIRGAIQIEDASLAYLLGASPRQVRRAREQLLREGILRFERREGPCDIYTMPGGTPVRPIDPDALEPLWTRRLATLTIGPFLLNLYASPSELDTAARLVDKIGEPQSIAALVTAFPTVEEHLHGREVLAVLGQVDRVGQLANSEHEKVTSDTKSGQLDRVGQLSPPCGLTDCLPTTATTKTSCAEPADLIEPQAAADPEKDDFASEGVTVRQRFSRRQFGREWYGCFYFANDKTHADILAILETVEQRHGQREAAFELRTACFVRGTKARGDRVLAILREKWNASPKSSPSGPANGLDFSNVYES